jgi:ubiquinone/menaquinone biosynthesis C-methylase UbiE
MENEEYRIMYHLEQSYWWFLGKQHLVKDQLCRLVGNNNRQRRILDIGSGTGIILKSLNDFGVAYGTDVSWEAIDFLKRRDLTRIVRADANHPLPFKDHSFSVVTCLDVLEHLDHDLDLLEEMLRVCKVGALILITVPAFHLFWSPHDVALHHKRRYTRKEILESIRRLDCNVLAVSYYNFLFSIPILVTRKVKSLFSKKDSAHSDFFLNLPDIVNRVFAILFKAEISLLRFLRYPFGISLLLILEKVGSPNVEAGTHGSPEA